ncbi:DUF6193 family natural product biosynthesis protein [Streptomyces barkulensis]|uniref:DUF6193 family natural product biosynthesis protein n=1 Tax=Streptomyces barkulensis TaxID=1257026 RepID=UPI001F0D5969|nr:DUF6193 family natural product biosynthesis protein [Streptomyces barkulensis]
MTGSNAPADPIETRWEALLDSEYVDSELVRAAYAEPRLRQLFPWAGMWELHFSRCIEPPFTWDVLYIAPRKGGGFLVEGPSRGESVGEADTAGVAVAIVVDHLPQDCDRAFVGNRHDLVVRDEGV